jgi:hypothetical protein
MTLIFMPSARAYHTTFSCTDINMHSAKLERMA